MKISKLTVTLDSGETINFEQHEDADTGCFSIEMKNPELISESLLEKAEAIAHFIFNSKF